MTLIEMLIGLVILGVLMALGVPSFFAWLQSTQVRNAAESIQNGLQLARAEGDTPQQVGDASRWPAPIRAGP